MGGPTASWIWLHFIEVVPMLVLVKPNWPCFKTAGKSADIGRRSGHCPLIMRYVPVLRYPVPPILAFVEVLSHHGQGLSEGISVLSMMLKLPIWQPR